MNKSTFLIIFIITIYVGFVKAQAESSKIDSFEVQKNILERNYEVEYNQFDSLLRRLENFGDIHEYVLERIGENRRTPTMHEYYPAYLSFLCNHMDSVYRNGVIKIIEKDSIQRFLAYPIVKSCLFETNQETCNYLISQDFKTKFIQTKSQLFESLMKLQKELKCSM